MQEIKEKSRKKKAFFDTNCQNGRISAFGTKIDNDEMSATMSLNDEMMQ